MAFEIVKNNFVGYFNPADCSVEKFRPWIEFLNDHSIIRGAISLNPPLKTVPLRHIYTTAVVSNDSKLFSFIIEGTPYVVNDTVINQALNLPTDNFVDPPTEDILTKNFTDIKYQGAVDLPRMNKKYLVNE